MRCPKERPCTQQFLGLIDDDDYEVSAGGAENAQANLHLRLKAVLKYFGFSLFSLTPYLSHTEAVHEAGSKISSLSLAISAIASFLAISHFTQNIQYIIKLIVFSSAFLTF